MITCNYESKKSYLTLLRNMAIAINDILGIRTQILMNVINRDNWVIIL